MPAKKKPSSDSKVFDVAKPGKSKPDIGSKPMIVGHRSMPSDPMVTEKNAEKPPEAESETESVDQKKSPSQMSKVKIAPISADMKEDSSAPAEADVTEKDKPSEPAPSETMKDKVEDPAEELQELVSGGSKEIAEVKDETLPPAASKEPEAKKTEDTETKVEEKPDPETPGDDAATEKDDKTDDKSKDKKGKLDPAAAAMEREDNLRKIVASKKYKLNIKESSSSSNKMTLIIVGVLIIAVVALFILIDTEILDLDIELPFEIFK